MTVADLIIALQQMPATASVEIYNEDECDYVTLTQVQLCSDGSVLVE